MNKSLLKRVVESISPDKRKFVKRQGEFAAKIDELLEQTGMTITRQTVSENITNSFGNLIQINT